jgi:iron complex outermembrane receptor protein
VEYARFWSDVDDLIMFVYVPFAQTAQATNVDKADINGHELALSFGRWRGLSFTGNLTRLEAVNAGPISYLKGKHLPHRPEIEASAGLTWLHSGTSATYTFDYVDGNYWNPYNGKAPNNKGPLFSVRRIHSFTLTVPVGLGGADFTLEARNLTGERFEDIMGYPMPGRSVYGTIALEI